VSTCTKTAVASRCTKTTGCQCHLELKKWISHCGAKINVYPAWWFSVVWRFICYDQTLPTYHRLVNIVKYDLALLFIRDTETPLDAIAHLYCCFKYSVLTMQLSQHYTFKTKRHFPCTIVPDPHERKQLNESEMIPTANSILTQRQLGFLIAKYFCQNILTTKQWGQKCLFVTVS